MAKSRKAPADSRDSAASTMTESAGCVGTVEPGRKFLRHCLLPKDVSVAGKWNDLKPVILKLLHGELIDHNQRDKAFGDIYTICTSKEKSRFDNLYDALKNEIENFAKNIYKNLETKPQSELLSSYAREWRTFRIGLGYVHKLFDYFNRNHTSNSLAMTSGEPAKTAPLKNGGVANLHVSCWKSEVVENLHVQLQSLIMETIGKLRSGSCDVNDPLIDETSIVIKSFMQLTEYETNCERPMKYYEDFVEGPVLADAERYYEKQAESMLGVSSVSEYLQKALELLDREEAICKKLLRSTSADKVVASTRKAIVNGRTESMEKAVEEFMAMESGKDLKNLYRLSRPLTTDESTVISSMRKTFEKRIKEFGTNTLEDLGERHQIPTNFVKKFLELHAKYSEMVRDLFSDDIEFRAAMDRALQEIINKPEPASSGRDVARAPERLAKFIDSMLRKSQKARSDVDMDSMLSQMTIVLQFIDGKDFFIKYYARHLLYRLLNDYSHSKDAESSCIAKLKGLCGHDYVSTVARMLDDIIISEDVTYKFNESLTAKSQSLNVPMSAAILSINAWPLSSDHAVASSKLDGERRIPEDVKLPCGLADGIRKFDDFYSTLHQGRKLKWVWQHSNAEVKLGFADKPYIVTMSVQQLIVLDLFQQIDVLTLEQIETQSNALPKEFVESVVSSLVEAKLLQTNDKELKSESSVSINLAFTSPRIHVRVPPSIVKKPNGGDAARQETDQVMKSVETDRRLLLQCTIVRVMKANQTMRHIDLVQKTIEACCSHFKPDVSMIKRVIDDLINSEYLKRTDKQDEYAYVA